MDLQDTGVARMEWKGATGVPEGVIEALMGPGAPFEMVVENIRGIDHKVFARQPRNLRAVFDASASRQGPNPFMTDGDRAWTQSEAIADIESISRLLTERYGIRRGDRVAILSANSPEYGLTMWATLSIGAIVTSLNGWWTGAEIEHGIALTSPAIILGDGPRLARIEPGIVDDSVPIVLLKDLYAEALALGSDGRTWSIDVDPDDPAVILFTSGTTGQAKGATLSHRNIAHFGWTNMLSGALGAMTAPVASSGPAPQPASILASPMFHVSGMIGILITGPALGAKLVFPKPGRWDPKQHLELTHDYGVNVWSGVPTQFWRLITDPDFDSYDLSALRSVGGGGAPFPPELVRELHRLLPNAVLGNGYGMSETVGLGTIARGQLMVDHPDSVGVAQPSVEVEIRGASGELVAVGEVGEIHLRTACVFIGYWNNEPATRAAIDDEGWYRTGDFGRVYDGLLHLESRMRDLILRGGENIYPIEIENRLVEHPGIRDAAVIGVDHVQLGQEVKAFVVLEDGVAMEPSEVQRWAAEKLATFKVPAYVTFRTELPYTETGKLQKRLLEAEEQPGREVDRA
ncbi:MAG: class I adenylate-forming enzyme family protein [Ilumatobacteraceae bacterium]